MKRIVSISTLFLLTSISCYSQSTYPKKITIGRDTVIAITESQLRDANYLLEERKIYKQGLDSAIVYFTRENERFNNTLSEKNTLIVLQKDQLSTRVKEVENRDKTIDTLNKNLKYQKSKTVKSTLVGTTVGVLIGTIVVLLVK